MIADRLVRIRPFPALLSALVLPIALSAAGPVRPSSPAELRTTPKPAAVEGVRTPVLPLDGEWRFHPAPPKGFETEAGTKARGWSAIRVPGDWTMQGFSVKPWTPAGYFRTFVVPADWRGRRIVLRFDAVQSLATVWVNGRPAGVHEGGFTAFEFDVTGLIRPGSENTIALAVQNESVADELASGTQYAAYQFGGLTRKVSLLALPPLSLSGLAVETDLDEAYRDATLRLRVHFTRLGNETPAGAVLRVRLADPKGRPISLSPAELAVPVLRPGEEVETTWAAPVAAPLLWDAEHPNLYALTLDLVSAGRTLETLVRRVGFRKIEVAGTQVFVNGRPVKLRGTNRHETHPLLGRSLTPELWRKDAELFRAANINYIRTSHYPPAEEFLDACDELGLFVECEAALVWVNHGANDKWKKEDPRDPKFGPDIERAVAEMIAFHRDHPSVLFWSLANESGWSPLFAAAKALAETMDPTRPKTFHDQAYGGYNNLGSGVMAVANYHYPAPNGPEMASDFARPLLYGEYCHVNTYNRVEIAADPGVRDEYGRGFQRMWEAMSGSATVLGGAIWAGINDVFFLPTGKAVGYGEWGLIDGWRREKPEYWHVKKSYSPVRVKPDRLAVPAAGAPLLLQVENRHDFTNLSELRIAWRVGDETGTVSLDLPPRRSGLLRIRPRTPDLAGRTLRLDFESPRGFLIDSYEIALGEAQASPPPFRTVAAGDVSLRTEGDRFVVQGGSFEWTFDRKSGAIVRAEAGGVPIVVGGPVLMVLPQTTGPCVTDYSLDIKPFNEPCAGWTAEAVEAREDGTEVVVSVKGRFKEAAGGYTVRFDRTGLARFAYEFKAAAKVDPRQYGLVLDLPRAFDRLDWLRRGQWSVYPEDHIGRTRGTARALVPGGGFEFRTEPRGPWKDDQNELGTNDFRSTKSALLWAALTSEDGRGLLLSSDGRHAARAFLKGDRVGWLIADFNTGGGDLFFASHHRADDRPLEAGDPIRGAFALRLISPGS